MSDSRDFMLFWKLEVNSFKWCNKNIGSILVVFREKTMDQWVKLSKSDCFGIFELNTSSDRVFYGLSEYIKIISLE